MVKSIEFDLTSEVVLSSLGQELQDKAYSYILRAAQNINDIVLKETKDSFIISNETNHQQGVSQKGVAESFSTASPISLYGSTKLASEILGNQLVY